MVLDLVLVDGSNELNRACFIYKDQLVDGEYGIIKHLFLSQILFIKNKFNCTKDRPLVIAGDYPTYWRKTYLEENKEAYLKEFPMKEGKIFGYKAQRKKDSELDWKEIYKQLDSVYDFLNEMTDIKVIKIKGCEADDIVATLCKYIEGNHLIVATDGDFKQLLKYPNVKIFNPMKQKYVQEPNPKYFLDLKIMTGDSGDNIFAFQPRVGEKTAIKLYPDLDSILNSDINAKNRWEINRKLIDFDYIPEEYTKLILDTFNGSKYNYNNINIGNYCFENDLKVISKKSTDFYLAEGKKNSYINETDTSKSVTVVEDSDGDDELSMFDKLFN